MWEIVGKKASSPAYVSVIGDESVACVRALYSKLRCIDFNARHLLIWLSSFSPSLVHEVMKFIDRKTLVLLYMLQLSRDLSWKERMMPFYDLFYGSS